MDLKQLLTPSPFSHNPQKRKSYNYNIHKHRRIEDLYLLVKEKTILRVILGRWLETLRYLAIYCAYLSNTWSITVSPKWATTNGSVMDLIPVALFLPASKNWIVKVPPHLSQFCMEQNFCSNYFGFFQIIMVSLRFWISAAVTKFLTLLSSMLPKSLPSLLWFLSILTFQFKCVLLS